jgi:WD40 repeat protein
MTESRVRVFVSSPSDLERERALIKEIVDQLAQEYLPYFRLQAVLWEEEALTAAQSFQAGLLRPSECEIVLVMLWTRLGTPLADDPYGGMTGTEWEFVDAVDASTSQGHPEVLVYKKTTPRLVDITNTEATRAAVEDRQRLEAFFVRHFHNPDGSFRRAFRQFDSDQRLRELVEGQLRRLLNRRISAERGTVADPSSWGHSPFRTGSPFEQPDEAVFVGRESETRELVSRLDEMRGARGGLVLISGPSGVGKSSLVRAGLLPRLARPFLFPGIATCRWWVLGFAETAPHASPIADLAGGLLRPEVLGGPLRGFGLDEQALGKLLAKEPGVAADQLQAALAADQGGVSGPGPAGRVQLALILDPLDGLLSEPAIDRPETGSFASALAELAGRDGIWIIATLRADLLRRLPEQPKLAALVDDIAHLTIAPPPAARIRQVMEIPARVAGIELETPEETSGRGLAERLEAEAASLEHWPPLLEATLDALFVAAEDPGDSGSAPESDPDVATAPGYGGRRRLTLSAYRELGGLLGVTLRRAEAVWESLGPEARAALPRLCRALIVLESGPAARPAPRDGDLRTLARDASCRQLLDAMVRARLVALAGLPDPTAHRPCRRGEQRMGDAIRRIARETREEWLARLVPRGSEGLPEPGPGAADPVGIDDEPGAHRLELGDYRPIARLTHPALIEQWAPMGDWVKRPENRRDLILRAQVNRQARQWKRTDCNLEYLLGEAGFAAAQGFAEAHPGELEPLEQELLEHSRERLVFQRRRNRAARLLGLTLIALLAVASAAFLWALEASQTATLSLHRSLLNAADQAIDRGNTPQAVRLALDAGAYLPQEATDILSRAFSGNRLIAVAQTEGTVPEQPLSPAFSDDGRQLATLSVQNGAQLWALGDQRFLSKGPLAGPELGIHAVRFAGVGPDALILGIGSAGIWRLPADPGALPDWSCAGAPGGPVALDLKGRYLALAHPAGEGRTGVCVVDLRRPGRPLWDQPLHRGEVRSLQFAPDGMTLVTAAREGNARLVDTITGFERGVLPRDGPLGRPVNRAVFDPTGELVALACADERVRLYAIDGRPLAELGRIEDGGNILRIHKTAVRDVAFSADGRFLVASDDEGQVVRWELGGGNPEVLGQHALSVEHLRIASKPDPREGEPLVLTASLDKTARLWGLVTGKEVAVFSHDAAVSNARFTRDGQRVLTYSDLDGSARIWGVAPTRGLAYRLAQADHVWHLDLAPPPAALDDDPDALLLAAGAFDGLVSVWRYDRSAPWVEPMRIWSLVGHRGRVRRVAFSPTAGLLASAAYDGSARVWDMVTGGGCALEARLREGSETPEVEQVLFAPDERWLLTAAADAVQPVRLWDPRACTELPLPEALDHGPSAVAAATVAADEDGSQVVATGNVVGTLRVARHGSEGDWRLLCRLQPFWKPITEVALAPGGRSLAAASEDGRAVLVDVTESGCGPPRYLGEAGPVLYGVAFAPDAQAVVTASLDGRAQVWSVQGVHLADLVGHKDRVYHAEFSPDGRWLLTASRDGTLRVWRRPAAGASGTATPQNLGAYVTLDAGLGGVAHARFSPDGHGVAGAYWDDAAVLWRLWAEEASDDPELVRVWGAERSSLALIREAARFRRENRLDARDAD